MAAGVLLVELGVAAALLLRLARRWREFEAARAVEAELIRREVERFRSLGAERTRLSSPHRRAWRWYRHPLTQAWLESRRRRAARERAAG